MVSSSLARRLIRVELVFVLFIGYAAAKRAYTNNFDKGCRELVANSTGDFMNEDGKTMELFDKELTWGITRDKCYQFCSRDKLGLVRFLFFDMGCRG